MTSLIITGNPKLTTLVSAEKPVQIFSTTLQLLLLFIANFWNNLNPRVQPFCEVFKAAPKCDCKESKFAENFVPYQANHAAKNKLAGWMKKIMTENVKPLKHYTKRPSKNLLNLLMKI